VLGDSQERHHDTDQDQGDSLRLLAHHFPLFFFRSETFRVLLSPAGGAEPAARGLATLALTSDDDGDYSMEIPTIAATQS
jgi:hypothetical protein